MSVPGAILAMIRAAVPGVTVYDGRVPDSGDPEIPPERYVAVYADHGTRADPLGEGRVDQEPTGAMFRWQTTCVAPDREMAGWLAGRVVTALAGKRPAAAGWHCGLIEHTFSQLPRPDELVKERPAVVVIDQFRVIAERSDT